MICSVWSLGANASFPAEFRASRNPLLFVRFVGSFVLRFAVRQFAQLRVATFWSFLREFSPVSQAEPQSFPVGRLICLLRAR